MEGKKFLDLDHLCDQVLDDNDRDMFGESIRCYQVGSHRASVILAWSVTADCLFKRICDLAAENDGGAQSARTVLHEVENTARFEETLIVQAKQCDLIDDYEEKCLRFARDTRSKCAHPTGVIPSAEAVRHILHICSQAVLCRNGFRGISFVKEFVTVKLKDRHLFSNKQRVDIDCRHFVDKVPDRVKVQFGAEIAKNFDAENHVWLENSLIFLRNLFFYLETPLLVNIARKLQTIESKNRHFFSIIVGLTNQEGIWEEQEISQSKAHIREALSTGRVNPDIFRSFGNLCALSSVDDDDKDLLRSRFSLLIDHVSSHKVFQEKCGEILLCLTIDALSDDESIQEQVKNGLEQFSCLDQAFSEESLEINVSFVDILIQMDWRDQNVSSTWQRVSSWAPPLQSAYLSCSADYLSECSEDYPDDILVLFDAAAALANEAPGMIPEAFEQSILDILEFRVSPLWFVEQGETYQSFIGQVNLLQERYTARFPRISEIVLPQLIGLEG